MITVTNAAKEIRARYTESEWVKMRRWIKQTQKRSRNSKFAKYRIRPGCVLDGPEAMCVGVALIVNLEIEPVEPFVNISRLGALLILSGGIRIEATK